MSGAMTRASSEKVLAGSSVRYQSGAGDLTPMTGPSASCSAKGCRDAESSSAPGRCVGLVGVLSGGTGVVLEGAQDGVEGEAPGVFELLADGCHQLGHGE